MPKARTREEMREYQRARRAKIRAGVTAPTKAAPVTAKIPAKLKAAVPALAAPPTEPSALAGFAMQAIQTEIERLPMSEQRPSDVAVALAAAKIMDGGNATLPQQPSAMRVLMEAMDRLRQGSQMETGHLARLRAMRQTTMTEVVEVG
jgi:hypothetical protein